MNQAFLSNCINYDSETGVMTKSKYSNVKVTFHIFTELCGKSYRLIKIGGDLIRAHKAAWILSNGVPPFKSIDHINGNGLDNRIENLRDVAAHENQKNRRLNKNSKSGHVGVYMHKASKKWCALIQVNGKKIHLGSFEHIDSAIEARRKASIEYGFHKNHGENRPLY